VNKLEVLPFKTYAYSVGNLNGTGFSNSSPLPNQNNHNIIILH